MERLRKWPVFTLCLFLLPVCGWAQEREYEYGGIEREKTRETEVAVAAKKAEDKKALEDLGKVTYGQILEEPDNIGLNFEYAKQQAQKNNLLGAAATLERILLLNPGLHRVRLFYAVVLFRLDNLNESENEFENLERLELPDKVRSEIGIYRSRIRSRRRHTRFTVRETVGYEIDTNRNAAPSSKTQLSANVPVAMATSDGKKRDTAFLNITSVDIVHDLGFQAAHELFGSFTYFLQEQTVVDSLDISSYQYQFGGTYKGDWIHWTPYFYASHVLLSRETFLRTQGGRLGAKTVFPSRINFFASYNIERQDFSGISENTTARERKGRKQSVTAGVEVLLTPTMKVSSSVVYTNKSAKEEFNGYQSLELDNSHTWLLGKGQFLINSLTAGFDRYDEVENAVAWQIRRDKTLRYRVTYGAPLTFFQIGKVLPKPLKDITLSASYEYFRELSNMTNYTYRNNKFQVLFSKRWEF